MILTVVILWRFELSAVKKKVFSERFRKTCENDGVCVDFKIITFFENFVVG